VTLRVLLPAGISFYTFQSMSYTIDVYRGHAPARTRFIDIAAFVSFFPHLVAGPIMRATNLLPQVERPRQFSAAAARDATVLIVWGFFKKLVIADNVGVIANKVFAESVDFFIHCLRRDRVTIPPASAPLRLERRREWRLIKFGY
jgi:D-alanyl-lipoteichoic acid acyltransferase DltB (MBOAT superfamily)